MKKISYSEFIERIADPNISDSDLAPYVIIVPGDLGLDFEIQPNPDLVEMTVTEAELESAMKIGNGAARLFRYSRFEHSISNFPSRPVVIAEGDSWFQFPFIIRETIDHLLDRYSILSLGAAGDTLQNMVYGPSRPKGFEFLAQLRKHRSRVQAFMFSAFGNDIIGNDPNTGDPMISDLLLPFNNDVNDIEGHINRPAQQARMQMIDGGYREMVRLVHSVPGLETLPILVHGYDVPYPYPDNRKDPRNPLHVANDKWLGRAFRAKGISNDRQRRAILRILIDDSYAMLNKIARDVGGGNVHVVDCRGALPDVHNWIDEIHGNSNGFKTVGDRFHRKLQEVIRPEVLL